MRHFSLSWVSEKFNFDIQWHVKVCAATGSNMEQREKQCSEITDSLTQ